MSLADELAKERATSPSGPKCPVGKALLTLDPNDATALAAALADRDSYTGAHIANVLARRGYPIRDRAVRTHRLGGCSCDQPG